MWDPRDGVEVSLFLRDLGQPEEGWTYTGMVGNASVSRLVQLAVERLQGEPAVLAGDRAFYEELAARKRQASQEWTAHYSRKGSRPKTGWLPQRPRARRHSGTWVRGHPPMA